MRKDVIAWSLYDLANTAFTSPFRTIFWPLLVTSFLGGNEFHIGLTVGIALLFVSFLVPIFGAFSDATNKRVPFIIWSTIFCVVLIAILPKFTLRWNLMVVGIITVLYNIGLTVYNSLLPKIASKREIGSISGIGMASGFLGTILSIGATYLVLKIFADGGNLETLKGVSAAFPVMAAFFLIFSLPLFFIIKDHGIRKSNVSIKRLFIRILSTLRNVSKLRGMVPFGIATLLFANAIAVIDVFFFLFARKEIGVGLNGFILLFSFQSIFAALGAYFFGRLTDKIGPKKTLSIAGTMWLVVVTTFVLSKSFVAFWIAGLLGSMAFGAVFSTSRAFLVFLAPNKKLGEFFGYSQIFGKFTGLFGPVIAGWLIVSYGYDAALIFTWAVLALAFVILQKVPNVRDGTFD